MKFLPLPALNAAMQKQLNKLCGACGGYEPFFQTPALEYGPGLVQAAAFHGHEMAGFISCLILGQKDTPPEAEITALVAPAFRRQGIFTALLDRLKATPPLEKIPLVCAVPAELFTTGTPSFVQAHAYAEYLLKCTQPPFDGCPCDLSPDFAGYESFFSDDGKTYLLYPPAADEPSAVCSLSDQTDFTALSGVFVDEDRRGKGLGTLLMQRLLRDYFKADKRPLVLNVRSTNTAACRLYQKCGFTEVSRMDYYFISR